MPLCGASQQDPGLLLGSQYPKSWRHIAGWLRCRVKGTRKNRVHTKLSKAKLGSAARACGYGMRHQGEPR